MHRTCCERATQPYWRRGGGTIYPGSRPAGVTTRSPRMVTECLPTRSMLIEMYLPPHGMCLYMYSPIQKVITLRYLQKVFSLLDNRFVIFFNC